MRALWFATGAITGALTATVIAIKKDTEVFEIQYEALQTETLELLKEFERLTIEANTRFTLGKTFDPNFVTLGSELAIRFNLTKFLESKGTDELSTKIALKAYDIGALSKKFDEKNNNKAKAQRA